ncbi:MAG TPA: helix-turn-helix domain-containing protein, partial [Acidimicrobiales bacterium]|nr:helix-turn-helix domain-containing protein [Acidimicrobiales bacterium]
MADPQQPVGVVGDLGRRVAERRGELGLSVDVVARRAGMDPDYLAHLERSPSPQLSRAALWRLAGALETTTETLTGARTQAPPGGTDPSAPPILRALEQVACRE